MNLTLLRLYSKKYILSVLFFGYMVFSVVLKSLTSIDMTISCPIKYTTGYECYGCGLTTASVKLLHFDIEEAFHANALIFLVLPVLAFLLVRHWLRFVHDKKEMDS